MTDKTNEDWNRILVDLIKENAAELVKDSYYNEVLSDYFKNDILKELKKREEENERYESMMGTYE